MENPKEAGYAKTITASYEKAQILQEEKIGLVEKAAALVGWAGERDMAAVLLTRTTAGPPRQAAGQQAARLAE